jgi:hypothetical protein
MSLFKSITDFSKYVKLNSTIEFDKAIQPYEPDAVRDYIAPAMSQKLFDKLHDYYNADNPTADASLDALLPVVQTALARFTMLVASPFLDINIGSNGFTTFSTQQLVPASEARVRKLDNATEALAWQCIEALLQFLELNKTNYPEWAESPAYTMNISNLINSALEFDAVFPINQSRLTFKKLRPALTKIEIIKIIPAISQELFDDMLVQLRANELSAPYRKLLQLLRFAEANFVMSQKPGDNFEADATAFLSAAMATLDASETDFPLYHASSVVRTSADYSQYENTEDSKIFVFGGGPCR